MVGAEDHHHMRVRLLDQVDVLVNGIGRSAIPGLSGRAHLRRNRNDEVALQQAVRFPAVAQMLQQRLALELDQDIDRVDAGIDEVAENEIDDPVTAAEGYCRLRSFFRERIKAGSFPAGQHKREHPKLHVRLSAGALMYNPQLLYPPALQMSSTQLEI